MNHAQHELALRIMRTVNTQGARKACKRYGRNNVLKALASLRDALETGA